MKLLGILLLSLSLVACSGFSKKIDPVMDSTKVVRIDPRSLELCPLLPEDVSINTFEDALQAYSLLGEKYSICAGKQRNSVLIIKELGNIK